LREGGEERSSVDLVFSLEGWMGERGFKSVQIGKGRKKEERRCWEKRLRPQTRHTA
jgi:hypothetical protein